MSRIGKQAISIPDGVTVNVGSGEIQVKGPKGSLSGPIPGGIVAKVEDGQLVLERPDDKRESRAMHGLARALVNNMVVGVSEGFRKGLEIEGVGYRAEVKGKSLNLLLGFSHPVEMPVPEGLTVEVEANTKVSIEGADRQVVGQFAADVRSLRPPEPYKGKGIRYEDEHIRRKVGKAGA
ncbi:MAG: 50S ribosomal protein L6 [Deltaproteobacteria bacterium]|jgi:large subunit ribosomal protein L6|nr:50S ribosomal protein L6 [Deltaproteobacteria bacterium]